jgi:hypothetical protein
MRKIFISACLENNDRIAQQFIGGKTMPKKPAKSHDGMGWHISKPKGYPRFNNCGPQRGKYIHRYEANKKKIAEGRGPLLESDEVHHGRGGKADFSWGNLEIVTKEEHGWKTARQCFWMRVLDVKREKEFYAVIEQLEQEGVRTGL